MTTRLLASLMLAATGALLSACGGSGAQRAVIPPAGSRPVALIGGVVTGNLNGVGRIGLVAVDDHGCLVEYWDPYSSTAPSRVRLPLGKLVTVAEARLEVTRTHPGGRGQCDLAWSLSPSALPESLPVVLSAAHQTTFPSLGDVTNLVVGPDTCRFVGVDPYRTRPPVSVDLTAGQTVTVDGVRILLRSADPTTAECTLDVAVIS